MARYYSNFTEEPLGDINNATSVNWRRIVNASGRTPTITNSGAFTGRKLFIDSGSTNAQSFIAHKDTINHANDCESLVAFMVDATQQVPGAYGIVNHHYNSSSQGYSLAFTPVSDVKSLILFDDKAGATVAFANFDWQNQQTYWVRYRQSGNMHYVRIWADGSPEPTTWLFTANYNAGTISGDRYAGVGTYSNNATIHYWHWGFATNGDTAVAENVNTGTYYNGYEYRKKLSVGTSQVTGSSDNFVALVDITDASLKVQAQGGKVHYNPLLDIRFEDLKGVKLGHTISSYDGNTGRVKAWVNVPTLTSSTEIYLYFGKDLQIATTDKFDNWSAAGIKVGFGSSDLTIKKNWYGTSANDSEVVIYSNFMTDENGAYLNQSDNFGNVAFTESSGSNDYCYVMYWKDGTGGRFTSSAGSTRPNFAPVRWNNGQWQYDNNNGNWINFTPDPDDRLVARIWSTTKIIYAMPLKAGEENNAEVYHHTYDRMVLHLDDTPDGSSATREFLDSGWRANPGSAYGNQSGSNRATGKIDYGDNLDGSDDYIHVVNDDNLRVRDDMTLSVWIYPRTNSGRRNIVSKAYGGEYELTMNDDYSMQYYWGTSGDNTGPYQNHSSFGQLTLNQWNHVLVSRKLGSGGYVRFYLNGSLIRTDTPAYSQAAVSNNDVTIGYGRIASYFNGIIDEVRLRSRALSNDEALAEYKNQNAPTTFWVAGATEQAVVINTIDILGSARIRRTEAATITGNARLQRTESTSITANARIRRTETTTIQGNARIRRTEATSIQGNARITRINSTSIIGNAAIESYFFTASTAITGNARIQRTRTTAITGNARIARQESASIVGSAHIERVESTSIQGNATLYRIDKLDIVGNATIEKDKTTSIIGNATIIRQDSLQITANARIQRSELITILGNAAIIRVDRLEIVGNARIERISTTTIVGNAKISNPSPDKRPQQWEDSSTEQPAEWQSEDRAEQVWDQTEDKAETTWENGEDRQEQQWSDTDNKQPTEWRRQFYD